MFDTYSAQEKSIYLVIIPLLLLNSIFALLLGVSFTSGIKDEQCTNYKIYKDLINDFNIKHKDIGTNVNKIINDVSINTGTDITTLLTKYKITIPNLTDFVTQLNQILTDSSKDYDKTNIEDIKDQTFYNDSFKSATIIKQNIINLNTNINKIMKDNVDTVKKNADLITDYNNTITTLQAQIDINNKNLNIYNSNAKNLNIDRDLQIKESEKINEPSYITDYRASIKDKILNYNNDKIKIQKQIEDNNAMLLKNRNDKNTKSDMKLNYQTKISTCKNN